MSKIEFSKQEKEIIIGKVQLYFTEKLDQDIGQFDAEFLLDFFSEEVGAYFYNRGLLDAQAVLEKNLIRLPKPSMKSKSQHILSANDFSAPMHVLFCGRLR